MRPIDTRSRQARENAGFNDYDAFGFRNGPLKCPARVSESGQLAKVKRRVYSMRKASMGSILVARRAGK